MIRENIHQTGIDHDLDFFPSPCCIDVRHNLLILAMLQDLWKIFHEDRGNLFTSCRLSVSDLMIPFDLVSPPAQILQAVVFGGWVRTHDCSAMRHQLFGNSAFPFRFVRLARLCEKVGETRM